MTPSDIPTYCVAAALLAAGASLLIDIVWTWAENVFRGG